MLHRIASHRMAWYRTGFHQSFLDTCTSISYPTDGSLQVRQGRVLRRWRTECPGQAEAEMSPFLPIGRRKGATCQKACVSNGSCQTCTHLVFTLMNSAQRRMEDMAHTHRCSFGGRPSIRSPISPGERKTSKEKDTDLENRSTHFTKKDFLFLDLHTGLISTVMSCLRVPWSFADSSQDSEHARSCCVWN